MASKYGYITSAELEEYAIEDYSAIDASLTDSILDSKISDAEMFINGYIGTTFTGTIPDDIQLCTKMAAKIFLDNWIVEHGLAEDTMKIQTSILENFEILQILEKYKDEYSQNQSIFISKRSHVPRIIPNYYPVR